MNRKTISFQTDLANEDLVSVLKKALGKKCACCVLITCSTPENDGSMKVDMSYEGDEMLASFLVDNASQVFDEKISKQEMK